MAVYEGEDVSASYPRAGQCMDYQSTSLSSANSCAESGQWVSKCKKWILHMYCMYSSVNENDKFTFYSCEMVGVFTCRLHLLFETQRRY